MTLHSSLDVSYNRPKIPACAEWSPIAVTFADANTTVSIPTGIFVNNNNTVYAVTSGLTSVLVWSEGSDYPTRNTFSNLNGSYAIFVSTKGDIYADDGYYNNRVEKWSINASNSATAVYVIGRCGGLFVDVYDSFYCSLTNFHQVFSRPIDTVDNASVIIAGNGISGPGSNMLSNPFGIFVDIDLSLYVADSTNNRIQLFRSGQLNGSTVAGNGLPGTISLSNPTFVVLDPSGYLYIADQWHHRIVGSGPNGFRCIAGCTGISGSASDQLSYPFTFAFDRYGDLYVTDAANNRIQKFLLATNSCRKSFP